MKDCSSNYMVETTCRLARWSIQNLSTCSYRRSDPFKIGLWNWHLALEKNRVLMIKLYPEISNLSRENPPIASFVIRVLSSVDDSKPLVHPKVTDQQLKNNDDFIWPLDLQIGGKFIIDVEFLDLKTSSPNTWSQAGLSPPGLSQARGMGQAGPSYIGSDLGSGVVPHIFYSPKMDEPRRAGQEN
ncbi:hypothetical protein KSS87_007361 [Heliosperma pusillum]|nr:hypothetical protein KSS87_007361 [Heliosperma pusillum]